MIYPKPMPADRSADLRTLLRARSQFNPKTRAGSRLRFEAHSAAHALDAFAHNGKSNSCPGIACAMQPFENLKNALMLVFRDANAVVLNPEPNEPIAFFRP